MPITHSKVSTKPDPSDTTLVRPSDWNAAHVGNGIGVYNVKDAPYSATGNGTTNDTSAINNALVAAGVGVTVLPPGNIWQVAGLVTQPYSKIHGYGTLMRPATNNTTVLALNGTGHSLQSTDFLLVRDLRIDGSGKTGVNGLATNGPSPNLVACILENILVTNVDGYAFDFGNSQFIRTVNLRAVGSGGSSGVGFRINNTGAGGNSHDHYGLQITGFGVGLIVNGTGFIPVGALNFYNPSILDSSVCAMAFFDATATVYGGAPEYNADGAASVVVDGMTVKKSSMYLNDSFVKVIGMDIAEASAHPCFLLENGSRLVLESPAGYGSRDGKLVECDDTSGVLLTGHHETLGICQNVVGWPDSATFRAQSIWYGEPVHAEDRTLPGVLYSHKAPELVAGGSNPPTVTYVEDADLGYCTQVVYTANGGNPFNVNYARLDVTGSSGMETVWSMTLKASADTQIGFNVGVAGVANIVNTDRFIFLKANKPTRLLVGSNAPGAGTYSFRLSPYLTDAPTIKFSDFQVYQGTALGSETRKDTARIVKYGAFNPGPLRATTAQLESLTADVNTKNKYPGKQVWNTTTNRVVFAAGRAAADVWKDGVNATVHTPV